MLFYKLTDLNFYFHCTPLHQFQPLTAYNDRPLVAVLSSWRLSGGTRAKLNTQRLSVILGSVHQIFWCPIFIYVIDIATCVASWKLKKGFSFHFPHPGQCLLWKPAIWSGGARHTGTHLICSVSSTLYVLLQCNCRSWSYHWLVFRGESGVLAAHQGSKWNIQRVRSFILSGISISQIGISSTAVFIGSYGLNGQVNTG